MEKIVKKVNKSENSFKKGFMQLRQMDAKNVREEIEDALGISERVTGTWYNRLNGKIEPRYSEAKKIEAIFSKYGITDVWGKM
jgi:hypothetical protein